MERARAWDIEGFLRMTGQWPLRGYIRYTVKGEAKKKYPKFAANASFDTIDHMPVDDDTNYTTTGFLIVKKYGPDFTPKNVAEFWTQFIPLLATCTAERIAYRNIAMNIAPPDSAFWRNPFREWIGAQIRADAFGYVNVGNPERAADFAWRDASISHVKNGIYGEMFVAAMLAAAPFANDLEELIKIGLSEVPKTSRLHADILKVLSWKKEGIAYEDAVQRIHAVAEELKGWRADKKAIWTKKMRRKMLRGQLDEVRVELHQLCRGRNAKKIRSLIRYFDRHAARMRYADYKQRGIPLGSGAVESCIRRVVNLRLKGNGIFWAERRAEGLLHMRAQLLSGQWKRFIQTILQPRPFWALSVRGVAA